MVTTLALLAFGKQRDSKNSFCTEVKLHLIARKLQPSYQYELVEHILKASTIIWNWSRFFIFIFLPSVGNFESEPQSASAIIPFGQQAVLYCKAGQGFFISKWEVNTPTREFSTNVPSHVNVLRILGITVNSSSSNESYLIINATQQNNGIRIRCDLLDTAMLIGNQSSAITTQFYGIFVVKIIIKCRFLEFSLLLIFFRSSSSSYWSHHI